MIRKGNTCLVKYSDCFINPTDGKLGLTDLTECKIEALPGTTPVCKYPYCLVPTLRDEMDKIFKDQIKKGLIEKSTEGTFASPALLIKKSNGGFWLVIDYRSLNAPTIPQNLRIPRIDEVFDTMGKISLNYFPGFYQVPLEKSSQDKMAFITLLGTFRYRTMP